MAQKFMVEKSRVEKLMVEKSGVERSGVEAWGWKVQGWDVLQPNWSALIDKLVLFGNFATKSGQNCGHNSQATKCTHIGSLLS